MQPFQIQEMVRLHQADLRRGADLDRLARGDRFAESARVDGGRSSARLMAVVAVIAIVLIGAGAILANLEPSGIVETAARLRAHA